MSYDQDPARWSTDPDEAPELLRGAFSAGRNEGPSRTQMRSLAVKLAAASAGGAVAVGTVKAASAGNTLTTAATWSAAKVASVVVLAGSVVTGAMIWRGSSPDDAQHDQARSRVQAPVRASDDVQESAPTVESAEQAPPSGAVVTAPAVSAPTAAAEVVVTPVGAQPSAAVQPSGAITVEAVQAKAAQPPSTTASGAAPGARSATERVSARSASSEGTRNATPAKPAERAASTSARAGSARGARVTSTSSAELPPPSEISLLRSAQVALQSRPREAFQLTQQHRRLYPTGEFAQERDALAIQALMRAGETDQARDLAQAFIRAYPTSPHAHRFREAMGLR